MFILFFYWFSFFFLFHKYYSLIDVSILSYSFACCITYYFSLFTCMYTMCYMAIQIIKIQKKWKPVYGFQLGFRGLEIMDGQNVD